MVASSTNKYFGSTAEYDSEREGWSSYFEKIELFLIANDITDKAKKKRSCLVVVESQPTEYSKD